MAPKYFLRDGSPADAKVWASKQGDAAYVQVDKTMLPSAKWVSTLWLGVEGSLFETVVFDAQTKQGVDRAKYATEAEARAGHQKLVAKWKDPA